MTEREVVGVHRFCGSRDSHFGHPRFRGQLGRITRDRAFGYMPPTGRRRPAGWRWSAIRILGECGGTLALRIRTRASSDQSLSNSLRVQSTSFSRSNIPSTACWRSKASALKNSGPLWTSRPRRRISSSRRFATTEGVVRDQIHWLGKSVAR